MDEQTCITGAAPLWLRSSLRPRWPWLPPPSPSSWASNGSSGREMKGQEWIAKALSGLVSPPLPHFPQSPSPSFQSTRHPAFALEGVGAWHALTLSCCQQLVGSVRLCADLR